MYCITSCDKSDESEVVVSLDNAFEYGYCKPGDGLQCCRIYKERGNKQIGSL